MNKRSFAGPGTPGIQYPARNEVDWCFSVEVGGRTDEQDASIFTLGFEESGLQFSNSCFPKKSLAILAQSGWILKEDPFYPARNGGVVQEIYQGALRRRHSIFCNHHCNVPGEYCDLQQKKREPSWIERHLKLNT
ncbi:MULTISPECIES: hypothetical protein [unclassified Variovorax]|uniref:hypothetical protein n=1 Tax=unclassified Variovorax TaxID=663243 RepID=UPI002576E93E|nr:MULTISPECIES: hypothetical protein [unclassified Variovorax]MDM0086447.1 hypothetical protein [Variovorax sp. J22G40]MDM0145296.1 hypothetical protein [Variovorax sp. J2P1-31]